MTSPRILYCLFFAATCELMSAPFLLGEPRSYNQEPSECELKFDAPTSNNGSAVKNTSILTIDASLPQKKPRGTSVFQHCKTAVAVAVVVGAGNFVASCVGDNGYINSLLGFVSGTLMTSVTDPWRVPLHSLAKQLGYSAAAMKIESTVFKPVALYFGEVRILYERFVGDVAGWGRGLVLDALGMFSHRFLTIDQAMRAGNYTEAAENFAAILVTLRQEHPDIPADFPVVSNKFAFVFHMPDQTVATKLVTEISRVIEHVHRHIARRSMTSDDWNYYKVFIESVLAWRGDVIALRPEGINDSETSTSIE